MPNIDYTDYRVVYIISEVNVSVGCPQLASTASTLVVGTSTKSTQDQGIKVGQEAHQEGYFNDRYLENSITYQQAFSPEKSPGYYNGEQYSNHISYKSTVICKCITCG